jgi:tetratricopeptide (TPR) repeat protein
MLRRNARDASSGAVALLVGALLVAPTRAQPIDPAPAPAANDDAALAQDSGPSLATTRRARDALIATGDFNAALTPAKAAVADPDGLKDVKGHADDLATLARVQAELRDIDAAEADYLDAIERLAKAEGEFSLDLVDFYRGLGRTYIRAARYPEAVTTLEQAQNISQRNLGLFNVEQSPLLDDLTTAYLGLGDTVEARQRQLDRLDNAVRRFGADDPRVIPYRYVLANYYERSRLPESARAQYEEVLKSQENAHGSGDSTLLPPLRQLVKIDLLISQTKDAERRDRLSTLIDQSQNADPVELGLSLATLGDWATVAEEPDKARDYYRQAWTAFERNPQFDVAKYFAKPVMIDFIAPLNSVDRGASARAYRWAEIGLTFDVSAEGLPSHLEILGLQEGADPTPIQNQYTRRLRETHFRPRLVAGDPVATTEVHSTHYYRVYVEKESRRKRKSRDEEKNEDKKDGEDG